MATKPIVKFLTTTISFIAFRPISLVAFQPRCYYRDLLLLLVHFRTTTTTNVKPFIVFNHHHYSTCRILVSSSSSSVSSTTTSLRETKNNMNEVDKHNNDNNNTNDGMNNDDNNNSKDDESNSKADNVNNGNNNDDEYFRTRYDLNYNPIITIPNTEDNNPSATVRLPKLHHGYRIVPLSWDECYDIIVIQKYIPKLSRSVQQQTIYEIYRYNMLKEWKSVIDQILCTKFNTIFEKRYDNIINKYYSYPLLSDYIKTNHNNTVTVTLNEFPYNMENNIEHYILWKLGNENITELDISNAKEEISLNNQCYNMDYIHWINPPHLKSIPDIDHIHILCRKIKK